MKLHILAASFLFAAGAHAAGMWGVDAQVSVTGTVPTVQQLRTVMPMGGQYVRDVCGWHKWQTMHDGPISTPPQFVALFTNVAAAGDKMVCTLAFGNKTAGYTAENADLPTTPEAVAAFAKYAAWIAKNVPGLYAVSIWNECNGSFCIGTVPERQLNYTALMRAVVPAVRAANPAVKIIAGATVGWNVQGWFLKIGQVFDWSSVDYLDFHPYLGDEKENPLAGWTKQLAAIRAGGIANPGFYSEWGGPNAVKAGPGYIAWFARTVATADPVKPVGATFFTLFGKQGLLNPDGTLSGVGEAFVNAEMK